MKFGIKYNPVLHSRIASVRVANRFCATLPSPPRRIIGLARDDERFLASAYACSQGSADSPNWKFSSRSPVSSEPQTIARQSRALATTTAITVRAVAGESYERITDDELGPMPEPLPSQVASTAALDDLPL